MVSSRSTPRVHVLAGACASLLSLSLTPLAHADGGNTVVVTAARAPQALTDALPHTTVITRDEIDRLQAVDLAALLATEAGVQLASNGGRGTATTLFMRGAPTRQVLVLVDGVPLSRQDATGQVGMEHLMLDQVERIEIVRGNVSALYGSGAVGGVIQVFTRTAGPRQAGLQVEVGSRGFKRGSAQASVTLGATRLSMGLSAEGDIGLSALNANEVRAANPDRDGYRNQSAKLDLAHRWAEGHTLGLGLFRTSGRLEYDSEFASPTDTQRSRTVKEVLQLTSEDRIGAAWISRVTLSSQRDDAQYVETGDYGYAGRYRTVVDSLQWQNNLAWSAQTQVTAGAQAQRERIDADDGFGGTYAPGRHSMAAYIGVQHRLGDHELAMNLRRDDFNGRPATTTGRLGWRWQLSPAWTALASASSAFGMPPLGYLYAPYYGNDALLPERSTSTELGLQWVQQGQRLRATLFRTRVRDEIEYDFSTYAFANLARTRNQGLELSYAGQVAGSDLKASLTSQQPEDAVTGQRRLRRSATLASVAVSRDLGGGWRAGLVARHAGERPDSGGKSLGAYTVLDLTAQWDINPQWQWFGRIENALNERYQTAAGYNQPPRGVFTGLRWKLPG
ncbi:MAG: TonB-dependent receptor [Ideonella sp.]|nr:TonB-dependent receptor [Ideonella sp.]